MTEIVNLFDHQEYLQEVAELTWKEWSSKHGAKLEDIIYRTAHSISHDIPTVLIAIEDQKLLGFGAVWRNDLTARQDLYPWLATLYVKEEVRSRGLGKMIQDAIIDYVKARGNDHLYLVTNHDHYYERNGWVFLGMAPKGNGSDTRLYGYEINKGNK